MEKHYFVVRKSGQREDLTGKMLYEELMDGCEDFRTAAEEMSVGVELDALLAKAESTMFRPEGFILDSGDVLYARNEEPKPEEPEEEKYPGPFQTEDKQAICDSLLNAIRLTRAGSDIEELRYRTFGPDNEVVQITYSSGTVYLANVSMDSGIAMMRDILKYL